MINVRKAEWIEALDEEISEAIELGDYDTAESLERVKVKSGIIGWRVFYITLAYIGYGYAVVRDIANNLKSKLR